MGRVPCTSLGVLSVVAIGSGVAWMSLAGVAAREAGQVQEISARAAALHEEAIVVDGHVHITELEYHLGIDPWKKQETGLFDYARAKEGGLDVVVHAVYTIDGYNMYNYGVKQALRLIETFYRTLEANTDKMELALTAADVRRIVASGKMAAILAIEGNPDMEGDLDVLRMWHRLGIRMIQLTSHGSSNALIDAVSDEPIWGGISPRGYAFIREMNRLGIIVDVSHSSEAAHLQAIEASSAPVADTHGSFRGRSLPSSAKVLQALAAKGGLLALIQSALDSEALDDWRARHPRPAYSGPDASGQFVSRARRSTLGLANEGIRPPEDRRGEYIAALDAEIRDEKARRRTTEARGDQYGTPWRRLQAEDIEAGMPLPTAEAWADHAVSVINLVGEDHVGIGLDLMARPAMRDFTAASYPRFTEAMLAKGLSPATIKKVLGENWLRLLEQAKVPGLEPPPR